MSNLPFQSKPQSQTQSQTEQLPALAQAPAALAELLRREFKPKSEQARAAVLRAVQTLARQALAQGDAILPGGQSGPTGQDAVQSIEALIAELDRKLSEQLNLILHHPEFQRLEGAWRGLQHLVSHTETDEGLKIRVLDVSK
ncbi:MAG: type secretion system contractile sheath large subunit, partial [Pseudomonadota bacterium]